LIRGGVTSKDAELVATVLAERNAGVPPSTIGRTYGIHHTTVNRILSAATALTGNDAQTLREPVAASAPHHEGAT
jgi:DNA invertase Pin-like site-specific DNA recombinase